MRPDRPHVFLFLCLRGCLVLPIAGCTSHSIRSATRQPSLATAIDPATTQPSYWLDMDGPTVTARDFDRLWNASERAARDLLFSIDRTDYRGGVMTTRPLTSRQWFEWWRPDVRTLSDLQESSLATTRRTVRFEFTRDRDGTFGVSPKVLIERQAIAEQRITSVTSYQSVFRLPVRTRDRPSGTRESDEGSMLPGRYWYLIGRDPALESAIAESIREKL